jgi:hypothetical protein
MSALGQKRTLKHVGCPLSGVKQTIVSPAEKKQWPLIEIKLVGAFATATA